MTALSTKKTVMELRMIVKTNRISETVAKIELRLTGIKLVTMKRNVIDRQRINQARRLDTSNDSWIISRDILRTKKARRVAMKMRTANTSWFLSMSSVSN